MNYFMLTITIMILVVINILGALALYEVWSDDESINQKNIKCYDKYNHEIIGLECRNQKSEEQVIGDKIGISALCLGCIAALNAFIIFTTEDSGI
jgi:hypothetical protein